MGRCNHRLVGSHLLEEVKGARMRKPLIVVLPLAAAALSVLGALAALAAEECKPGSPNCICDNEETGKGCYLEHQPPPGSTCALHTSDFKGAWQCGDVCVRRSGNPGDRAFTI